MARHKRYRARYQMTVKVFFFVNKCKVEKQIALNDTANRFLEMRAKELLIIVLAVFVFSHSKKGWNKPILFFFTVFLAVYFAVNVYKPQS